MKKLLCIALTLILCVSFIGCGTNDAVDNSTEIDAENQEFEMDGVFRYANWGDSMEKVESKEPSPVAAKNERVILYENIDLLTYTTDVTYFFGDNGLDSGMYSITNTHTNANYYINDFSNVNKALTEKYGEPTIDEQKWYDDIMADDPASSLSFGYVEYVTCWKTDKAEIFHTLSGDNFEIQHSILYLAPNREDETDTTGL